MRKQRIIALLLSLVAVAATAQKGPVDELGFHPEKLYAFNDIDSVNLFNGNLTLSIPLGVRYQVSSHLSYQFMLVYNGKVWDYEQWQCSDGCPPVKRPSLRANAGLGWRVSLGRLLPPYHATVVSSLDRNGWMYEGPAGDEHFFAAGNGSVNDPVQVNVPAGLRMIKIDDNTRDVEFASGEIHRFVFESNDWRLKQIRDRYNNAVNINYTYYLNGETRWDVTDTVGRSHNIQMTYNSAMSNGWSRGWMVQDAYLEGFGGGVIHQAHYHFTYQPRSYFGNGCAADGLGSVPELTNVSLPDQTAYAFSYAPVGASCVSGELYRMTYPTGGTVTYTWSGTDYPDPLSVCAPYAFSTGISSRTVDDGTGPRKWDYIYNSGANVAVTYMHYVGGVPQPDPDPCQIGVTNPPSQVSGPVYWGRTSVVSPVDSSGHRNRTDHYFNILSNGTVDGYYEFQNPLNAGSGGGYGYSGPTGVAPLSARRGPPNAQFTATDVASSAVGGGLATEVFGNCDSAGDCTNGTLLRSTYDTYEPIAQYDSDEHIPTNQNLLRTRDAYNDDTAYCSPSPCYTQWTKSDNNGVNQYRTSTLETNFPSLQTATTTTNYPSWSTSDLTNTSKLWVFDRYTEKTRTEGGATVRETFCFDDRTTTSKGDLLRHRVLAGANPGPNDLLQVFTYNDGHGNLDFSYDYGGDAQTVDTGPDLCTIPLPSPAWYKVENSYMTTEGSASVYTGGVLATSRYYDRNTGSPFGFFSLDRTIDRWTSAVTASRDTAGTATSFSYDPFPARLKSTTSPAGAVTNYTYTPASGMAGAGLTQAKIDVSTLNGAIASQFVFDGLGRIMRSSARGPESWVGSETKYDQDGRVVTKSEPESTGSAPPSGPLLAADKTSYTYDPFGRTKSVTTPEGSVTTFDYVGVRLDTRTSGIWTGSIEARLPVISEYDGFGRLISVTEKSGPTTSTSVTGADVFTSYAYDAGNHMASVKMGTATGLSPNRTYTGPLQTRIFDHDGRGFLRWESQPESAMTSYSYDARGHVTSKTQSAANTAFNQFYTYDSAERLRRIDGRNPLYDPNNPLQPLNRSLKEFVFGDANGTFQPPNSSALTDLKRGKLVSATRHNYGETVNEPVYDITHTYHYCDTSGHLTHRVTDVNRIFYGYPSLVQEVTMSTAYDQLDQPTTVTYPMCDGCGAPPVDADRSGMTRTYSGARLKSLSVVTDPGAPATPFVNINYWPNGIRNVLSHANGINDTQTASHMPRPDRLQFGTSTSPYDRCVHPTLVVQPASTPTTNGSATLSVSVSGTAPFTYEWFDWAHFGTPAITHTGLYTTTDSITVSPTSSTTYNVRVSNPCGFEDSQGAKITVDSSCPLPTTGVIQAVAQPDGSWILKPNITARQPRTYTWTRMSDGVTVGVSEQLPIGVLAVTTTYRLTITDSCGSGSGQVTITVPLPITNGMQATWSVSTTQVSLTWPAIAGAGVYSIERRSNGGAWEQAGTSATTSFTDTTAAQSRTYIYRVTAENGGQTNYDVATTRTFVQATPRTTITATEMNSMLDALNSVRAAVGWPAVTWSSILAASDPVPAPHQIITARQLMACRARMNEALQALGVRVSDYIDPDLLHLTIKAAYINEVEQRAQ